MISSEASYLKSLNILISHFVQSDQFSGEGAVVSKRDQRILFSEALQVRAASERFLADLESRWQESVLLTGICDIIRHHARENFQVGFHLNLNFGNTSARSEKIYDMTILITTLPNIKSEGQNKHCALQVWCSRCT